LRLPVSSLYALMVKIYLDSGTFIIHLSLNNFLSFYLFLEFVSTLFNCCLFHFQ